MYRVMLMNHNHFLKEIYDTFQEAYDGGKLTGFEFSIWKYSEHDHVWMFIGACKGPDLKWTENSRG